MRLVHISITAILFGCGAEATPKNPEPTASATPPTASTTVAAKPIPPAAACLPQTTRAHQLVATELAGNRAVVCYATKEDASEEGTCADVDVTSGAITKIHAWQRPAQDAVPAQTAVVTATENAIKICKTPSTCSTVKTMHKPVSAGVD
jgi:hypothetical protein